MRTDTSLRINIRRRLGSAVGLAALLFVTTACGGSGADEQSGNRDELKIAYVGGPASLDPHLVRPGIHSYLFPLYDRLVQYDNEFNIKPMLASSWTWANDGSYLDLKLREDVDFHDGTHFDAAAVKANIERGKQIKGSNVALDLESIESVAVVDKYTARLNFATGKGSDVLDRLAKPAGMMISPAVIKSGTEIGIGKSDAGSGPYVVQDHDPQTFVRYVKSNQKHWDEQNVSAFKSIELTYVLDGATRQNGVRSGEFDLAQITGDDAIRAKKQAEAGAFKAFDSPQIHAHTILLRNQGALSDIRVRRAIEQAIDKEGIGRDIYEGTCKPNDFIYQPTNSVFDPEYKDPFPYDPSAAKSLLADAGYTSDKKLNFTIVTQKGSSYAPLAEVVQAQLAAVGINAKVQLYPAEELNSLFASKKIDNQLYVFYGWPNPGIMFSDYFVGENSKDLAGSDRSKLSFLKRAEDPATSDADRTALYRKGLETVIENSWVVPICNSTHTWIQPNESNLDLGKVVGFWYGSPDFSRNLG